MAIADTRIEAASADDFATLFEWHKRDRMPGVIVAPDPMFLAARTKIVSRAARGGLPAIYNLREFADIGGHLGYGPGIRDAYHREAPFANRAPRVRQPGSQAGRTADRPCAGDRRRDRDVALLHNAPIHDGARRPCGPGCATVKPRIGETAALGSTDAPGAAAPVASGSPVPQVPASPPDARQRRAGRVRRDQRVLLVPGAEAGAR